MNKDEKDAYYKILSFGLWRNFVVYNTRLLLSKKFILELFWRAKYSTIKGRIACWQKYGSWRTCRSQRRKCRDFREIDEGLAIEEELEIKIVKEINEDLIIEKDLEVETVETIKEEIIEEVVKNLDEVKLDNCNVQTPIILVGDTKTKFIDFIGVERFDMIIDTYLVDIVNCMKIKGQEVQVAWLMTFKFGKKTKKMMYSKYLFSRHGRFQISKMNSRTSLFQVK